MQPLRVLIKHRAAALGLRGWEECAKTVKFQKDGGGKERERGKKEERSEREVKKERKEGRKRCIRREYKKERRLRKNE